LKVSTNVKIASNALKISWGANAPPLLARLAWQRTWVYQTC